MTYSSVQVPKVHKFQNFSRKEDITKYDRPNFMRTNSATLVKIM